MEVPHLGLDKVPFILSVVHAFTALRHLGYPQAGVGIADNPSPRIFGLFFFSFIAGFTAGRIQACHPFPNRIG